MFGRKKKKDNDDHRIGEDHIATASDTGRITPPGGAEIVDIQEVVGSLPLELYPAPPPPPPARRVSTEAEQPQDILQALKQIKGVENQKSALGILADAMNQNPSLGTPAVLDCVADMVLRSPEAAGVALNVFEISGVGVAVLDKFLAVLQRETTPANQEKALRILAKAVKKDDDLVVMEVIESVTRIATRSPDITAVNAALTVLETTRHENLLDNLLDIAREAKRPQTIISALSSVQGVICDSPGAMTQDHFLAVQKVPLRKRWWKDEERKKVMDAMTAVQEAYLNNIADSAEVLLSLGQETRHADTVVRCITRGGEFFLEHPERAQPKLLQNFEKLADRQVVRLRLHFGQKARDTRKMASGAVAGLRENYGHAQLSHFARLAGREYVRSGGPLPRAGVTGKINITASPGPSGQG